MDHCCYAEGGIMHCSPFVIDTSNMCLLSATFFFFSQQLFLLFRFLFLPPFGLFSRVEDVIVVRPFVHLPV